MAMTYGSIYVTDVISHAVIFVEYATICYLSYNPSKFDKQ
jgi:hypothetical protein